MTRYYKLFDLLNRKGMKKTDLLEIISSKTLAKLSKGEYVGGEIIEKICLFLKCQPNDIMEIFEAIEIPEENGTIRIAKLKHELLDVEEIIRQNYYEDRQKSYDETRKKMELEE